MERLHNESDEKSANHDNIPIPIPSMKTGKISDLNAEVFAHDCHSDERMKENAFGIRRRFDG